MKRFFIIYLFLLASALSLTAQSNSPDTTYISPGPFNGNIGNRAPANKPVTICYYAPISSVVLSFTAALGTVDILIVNSTTGEFLEGEVISSPGSFPIPISGTPGDYYVVAFLPNGKQFETEFQL